MDSKRSAYDFLQPGALVLVPEVVRSQRGKWLLVNAGSTSVGVVLGRPTHHTLTVFHPGVAAAVDFSYMNIIDIL